MGRRSTPERIYAAQRAGVLARLRQAERVGEAAAEDWVTRWERHAESEGLDPTSVGHWDRAWEWIASQRGH